MPKISSAHELPQGQPGCFKFCCSRKSYLIFTIPTKAMDGGRSEFAVENRLTWNYSTTRQLGNTFKAENYPGLTNYVPPCGEALRISY